MCPVKHCADSQFSVATSSLPWFVLVSLVLLVFCFAVVRLVSDERLSVFLEREDVLTMPL
jgi:hypothetical protein